MFTLLVQQCIHSCCPLFFPSISFLVSYAFVQRQRQRKKNKDNDKKHRRRPLFLQLLLVAAAQPGIEVANCTSILVVLLSFFSFLNAFFVLLYFCTKTKTNATLLAARLGGCCPAWIRGCQQAGSTSIPVLPTKIQQKYFGSTPIPGLPSKIHKYKNTARIYFIGPVGHDIWRQDE